MIRKQKELFLTALMFFTRIPVKMPMGHNTSRLPESAIYFPWVGWIIGVTGAIAFFLFSLFLSPALSVFLSMMCTILLTGAFHEDGFADVCDGFGGGWTKEKILAIMKDSRLGTFGVTGLVAMLSFKFMVLQEIALVNGWRLACGTMIVGHVLSRFAPLTMLMQYQYVNGDGGKPGLPFEARIDRAGWLVAGTAPLLALCLLPFYMWIVVLPVGMVRILAGRYFKRWIGGYTGDCLGAIQQMSEVMIYFIVMLLCKYI